MGDMCHKSEDVLSEDLGDQECSPNSLASVCSIQRRVVLHLQIDEFLFTDVANLHFTEKLILQLFI